MRARLYKLTMILPAEEVDRWREGFVNVEPIEDNSGKMPHLSHPENEPEPKGEAWRELEATDRQLELLDRMKVGYELPLKRGEASELIDTAMRNRPRR